MKKILILILSIFMCIFAMTIAMTFSDNSDCEDFARISLGEHTGECSCEGFRSLEDAIQTKKPGSTGCREDNYAGYGCFMDENTGELYGSECNYDKYWENQ